MVAKNIANKLGLSEEKIDEQVAELFSSDETQLLEDVLKEKIDSLLPGNILTGIIVSQIGGDVIVEVGLKSEGLLDASEHEIELSLSAAEYRTKSSVCGDGSIRYAFLALMARATVLMRVDESLSRSVMLWLSRVNCSSAFR